ncbi:substrate-binding periplasmic protein [Streptomyces lavendulocolor]|uniref:substrate-binding periplasmic protein n=1 Tax=Streptomyces lavendulocolor TaxID=67316 RepID=UPI0033F35CDB
MAVPHFLTICTIQDLRPSIFKDPQDGWHGFEADLLTGFAHTLGLEPQFRIVPFEKIWLRPLAGECDIAAAGITILPERISQGTRFSRPVFRLDQSLLIRAADSRQVRSISDLSGAVIGVLPGTTGETSARRRASRDTSFHTFDSEEEMIAALRAGTIDAIARGTLGNTHQADAHPDLAVTGIEPTDEWIGFATAPDNPALRLQLDFYLRTIRATGRLAALHKEWFPAMPVPPALLPLLKKSIRISPG